MVTKDKSSRNLREVQVSELKPGYVLSESIGLCGLSKGHVLSLMDIQKIILLNIPKVHVFLLETENIKSDDELNSSIKDIHKNSIKKEIAQKDLTKEQKLSSMTDSNVSVKLKELVELKKELIRGENYQEKINENQEKHKARFNNVLKKSSIQFIEDAMKVINDHSISSADLEGLEKVEALSAADLIKKMENYEKNTEIFLNAVINNQMVYSSFVEDILADLLSDIGYKLSCGLLARVFKEENYNDFLSNHSLQVVIVALITAIELTKMVQEKTSVMKDNDLEMFTALGKKFFSLEDMINVGIAAFLHDISFKKNIPNLASSYKFNLQDQTINALHSSEGFHISKKLDVNFEVQSTIYQHNERFDGSGVPNGLLPRFFSRYTPVLMFAEYFVESTTVNPFYDRQQNPRAFLMNLLNNERNKFDGDVVYAFIRAASMYPVGTWVFLKDEKIGMVAGVNKSSLDKPVVIVFLDEKLNKIKPYKLDLSKESMSIVNPVSFSKIRNQFEDPKKEIWSYLYDYI